VAFRKAIERGELVIVTYNHMKYMEDCLSSVLANDPLDVIVVDNCSADGTAESVEDHFPEVRLIKSPRNPVSGRDFDIRLIEGSE